ncbi:hypothetical protein AVEN_226182-1 [Araneus ventricosus]|uniref:Uncharacterized protein n=1 Tax=Araneus ventricosus TaxID=182803 RepID=A0A4Y2PBK6_ARAVE|nr:hypothetical protein AVEN_226182-1 [Araneus ventricosus]
MMLYSQILGKHATQVTGTIALVQINNASSQQFTSNNSNSTFNSALVTGFPARTADETPKSFALRKRSQSINTFKVDRHNYNCVIRVRSLWSP